jgi:hypothetical protein
MKVAIVHDWLVVSGGAEKVLEQMIACFPQADIFSLVDFLEDRSIVHNKPVKTSFIQRLPYAKKKYRGYLPLMPLAIEQFDLSGYDLVLSSSHAVAKGVLVGPDQTHVSYVHSPIRYAWDLQHQYLREARLEHGPRSWAARMLLHYLRNWDARSANGVDRMIANSQFVARRIMKSYRREAAVIAPPVDVQAFEGDTQCEHFGLSVIRGLEGPYATREGLCVCRGRRFWHCYSGSAGVWYACDCLWQGWGAGVGDSAWIAGGDGFAFHDPDAGVVV